MCYCPTPTLHLNLALTGDGAFLFSTKKTHSVWFISVLNYGDTENILINHLLLVIPMSYPCHYTNLCPHKPHKHAHTHTHSYSHTHTHTDTQTHTHTHVWSLVVSKVNLLSQYIRTFRDEHTFKQTEQEGSGCMFIILHLIMTFLLCQPGKLTVPPVLQRHNDQRHASHEETDSRNHSKSATDKITFGLGCCLRRELARFWNRAIDKESSEDWDGSLWSDHRCVFQVDWFKLHPSVQSDVTNRYEDVH